MIARRPDYARVGWEFPVIARPPVEITSASIEQTLAPVYERLHLPAGRLELMTGIRARRFWDGPCAPSAASTAAATAALDRSALDRRDIDLLIHCAVCRDRLEPATAAYVHAALGLGAHTQFFDVSNACLGFLNGCITASAMVAAGTIRSALVCAGENGKPLLDRTIAHLLDERQTRKSIKPLFANLTIGCGAVAMVIADRALLPEAPLQLLGHTARTDSAASVLCQGDSDGDGLEMRTDAEQLLDAGIALGRTTWQAFLDDMQWTPHTPHCVLTHQVGRMHQLRLTEALGFDPDRDFITYPEWGNVGSVSLPLTLGSAIAAGALRRGQHAALLGIGSGLTCLMAAIQRLG